MKKKKVTQQLSPTEMKLVEQLRQHPQMMARFQEILALASNEDGPLKTADEIEELLMEAMRQLGNQTMGQWASQAEERVSRELKEQDPTVLARKKKR
jgi:uncharacterized NAD(P)/FAD-binding protein YdhS